MINDVLYKSKTRAVSPTTGIKKLSNSPKNTLNSKKISRDEFYTQFLLSGKYKPRVKRNLYVKSLIADENISKLRNTAEGIRSTYSN